MPRGSQHIRPLCVVPLLVEPANEPNARALIIIDVNPTPHGVVEQQRMLEMEE